jgi:5'-3' exonuclease
VTSIEDILGSLLTVTRVKKQNITLIFVVDGMRPPSKDDENADRQSKVEKGQKELEELYLKEIQIILVQCRKHEGPAYACSTPLSRRTDTCEGQW